MSLIYGELGDPMSKSPHNKTIFLTIILLLIVVHLPSAAYSQDWEIASGGMSIDDQTTGTFAATGTGPIVEPEVWANVTSSVTGTGGAEYISGQTIVAPKVTLDASGYVDLYVGVVLGDFVFYYNACADVFGNPWEEEPLPCILDTLTISVFELPAYILADLFPEMPFVPLGIFVRAVKTGTGINGYVLSEAQSTTYLSNAIVFPAPAVAPW